MASFASEHKDQIAKVVAALQCTQYTGEELEKKRSQGDANTADVKWLPNEYPIMSVRLGGIFKQEHLTLTSRSRWVPNRVYDIIGKMKGYDEYAFGVMPKAQTAFALTDAEIEWIKSMEHDLKSCTTMNHSQLLGLQKMLNELRRKREEYELMRALAIHLRKELKKLKSDQKDVKSGAQTKPPGGPVVIMGHDEGLNTDDPCDGIFSEAEGGICSDCDAAQDEEHDG